MNCGCRIALVMVLVTAGCGQDARLSELDAMIDRHVVGLLDAEGPRQGTNVVLGEGLKKIESLSNDVAQVGCMTAWADRILAARIDATDYHLWSRRINVVPSQIEGIVAGIRRSHADVDPHDGIMVRIGYGGRIATREHSYPIVHLLIVWRCGGIPTRRRICQKRCAARYVIRLKGVWVGQCEQKPRLVRIGIGKRMSIRP